MIQNIQGREAYEVTYKKAKAPWALYSDYKRQLCLQTFGRH